MKKKKWSNFLQNCQKNGQKWPTMVKNGRILKIFVSSFFHPKEPPETGTGHSNMIFGLNVTAK